MPIELSILHDGKIVGKINLEERHGFPVPAQGDVVRLGGNQLRVTAREFYFFGPIQRVILRCEAVPRDPRQSSFCVPWHVMKKLNK